MVPLALGLVSLGVVCGAAARAPAQGTVAMLFPPWWTQARSYAAASAVAPVVRLGGMNFVMIVAPADDRRRAGLYRAGAWLLLDPIVLSGCQQYFVGDRNDI
jgi:hypothetical protein